MRARAPGGESRETVRGVFARAAPHYDAMNDALSFFRHRLWKRLAARALAVRRGMRVLDVAGGSGDMARLFANAAGTSGRVVLADCSAPMLALAQKRMTVAGTVGDGNSGDGDGNGTVSLCHCDAERLPFADGAFDRAAVAFGLRNICDRPAALAEMRRVLAVGGKMLILEFSPPQTGVAAAAQRWYLRRALPFLGARLFGDGESYRYLGESVLRFLPPRELAAAIRGAGFSRLRMRPLAGGIVQLSTAWKIQ